MKGETRLPAGGKQQIGAERGVMPGERDRPAGDALARGEMPALVEFAVVRQKDFRDDAEHAPAMDRDRAVVELPMRAQWRADDKHRKAFAARLQQAVDLALDRVEQRVLKQQIVDRIGREAQLGKHHQPDPGPIALGEQRLDRRGVARGVGYRDERYAGADTEEIMPVGREKRRHRGPVLAGSGDPVNLGTGRAGGKGLAVSGWQ